MYSDDFPNTFGIHRSVVMDEDVAEINDLAEPRDFRGHCGIDVLRSPESLSDDHERPFDGCHEHAVCRIIFKCLVRCVLLDFPARLQNVFEPTTRVTRHRGRGARRGWT